MNGLSPTDRVANTRLDPLAAAGLLSDWGFLVRTDLPDGPTPSYLLVALREQPTLRHFDPEAVRYWETRGGRGRRVTLTRRIGLPVSRQFAWGQIEIEDRLGVTNEYLTFGGRLFGAAVEDATVLVFESAVPILRRGGHSQGWDRGADLLAAFFARLKVAVDYVPGFEEQLGSASPEARYVAFLRNCVSRYEGSERLRTTEPELWQLVRSECRSARATHPGVVAVAEALLERAVAIPH